MGKDPGWSIDVESCSTEQLVELAKQLKGSEHRAQLLAIQREMVARLRKAGFSDQKIVDALIANAWAGDRAALAKEWAEALGMTEKEFKRLASGK